MRKTLSCLINLQKVDSQIHEIVKVRDTYPARVQTVQDKMTEQEMLRSKIKVQLDELQQERKIKEQLLQGEEDKLKKWERRLMESKNPREAAPLAREIDAQKRLNSESQDELLRLMTSEERFSKEFEEFDLSLAELRKSFESEKKECDKKIRGFNEKLSTFESERSQFTEQVPSSLLRKYEMIKKRREGLAVVPARNGCCTGCNMRLRPQLYNIIQKVQSLETCPSCQRILYWEEGLVEHGAS